MMDTGGGTPIRDQSFFSFYQDVFKLEFLSGLEFFFLKLQGFCPLAPMIHKALTQFYYYTGNMSRIQSEKATTEMQLLAL